MVWRHLRMLLQVNFVFSIPVNHSGQYTGNASELPRRPHDVLKYVDDRQVGHFSERWFFRLHPFASYTKYANLVKWSNVSNIETQPSSVIL